MSSERVLETLQSTGAAAGEDEVGREIARLGPWFHNLHLPSGHQTAPDHPLGDFPSFKWRELQASIPNDLTGWTVLDIGCNAGFYSFALARRGAEVLGVDHDAHYLRQARWAAKKLAPRGAVQFERKGVYDLVDLDGSFDLVLFLGVLYHLRYPLLALDIVATKVRRLLVVQTLSMPGDEAIAPPDDLSLDDREAMLDPGWPKLAFIENRLAGDGTNWWAPNEAAIRAMLRSCGLRVTHSPAHEFYVCQPTGERPATDEMLAATRQTRVDP
jgi:tRNA (mo5U34)-methyltransferase